MSLADLLEELEAAKDSKKSKVHGSLYAPSIFFSRYCGA
ncbi:TPA: DNA alkylation repair enzyme family protein [Streptococcus pneumoniae]